MWRWGITCIVVGIILNLIGLEILSMFAIIPGIFFFIFGLLMVLKHGDDSF